jgi:hypothetical protein
VGEIDLLHVPTSSLIAGILRMLFSYMRVSSALLLLSSVIRAIAYLMPCQCYTKLATQAVHSHLWIHSTKALWLFLMASSMSTSLLMHWMIHWSEDEDEGADKSGRAINFRLCARATFFIITFDPSPTM